MTISAAQVRAAMGLLDLDQTQLAGRAGMTRTALNQFLLGKVDPRPQTLRAIETALVSMGVEFGPRDSISRADDAIRRLTGPDCYLHLMREIDDRMKASKGEVLFGFVDHRKSNDEAIALHNQMQAHGIKARLLIGRDMHRLLWPRHNYRVIPDDIFVNRVIIVYGDYSATALYNDAEEFEFLVLRNKSMADGMRAMFEGWWRNSPMPEDENV